MAGRWLVAAVLALTALGVAWVASIDESASIDERRNGENADEAGRVQFLRVANSAFDAEVLAAEENPRLQAFWDAHYSRIRAYAPFYERHSYNGSPVWTPPPTDFYRDLYAIYNDRSGRRLIARHPDWVLRDAAGQPLYIQFECSGQSCTQFAADVGNAEFRSHWIAGARRTLAAGYDGIFIDDVNLQMKVSDGTGSFTRPIDPRTGMPMTNADWRRYVADFTVQVREAFPEAEIGHNSIWFVDRRHPQVARAADAADYVVLERGATDPGHRAGRGRYGFDTFLDHIDWLHDRGLGVVLEPYGLNDSLRELELAVYFLISNGTDAIASTFEADPGDWWRGWDADLGSPEGERTVWRGVLRREFSNGMVLVNPAGSSRQVLALDEQYETLEGDRVSRVTLAGRQGRVLLRDR